VFFFTKPVTFSLQLIPLITKAWSVQMTFQSQLLITGLLQCCVTSVGASCQHFNGSWCLQLQHHTIKKKNYWKHQDPLKLWQLLAIPHELNLQLHHCANVRSQHFMVSESFICQHIQQNYCWRSMAYHFALNVSKLFFFQELEGFTSFVLL
jgi:hypothetical protein